MAQAGTASWSASSVPQSCARTPTISTLTSARGSSFSSRHRLKNICMHTCVVARSMSAQHIANQVAEQAATLPLAQQSVEDAPQIVSLLQALLQRAELEAQQQYGGARSLPAIDTSTSDAILSRLPGKDTLTKSVAELIKGSETAGSQLQSFLQGLESPSAREGGSHAIDGIDLQELLPKVLKGSDVQGAVEGLAQALGSAPSVLQESVETVLQGVPAEQQLQQLLSKLQDSLQSAPSLVPHQLSVGVQAAMSELQSELHKAVQTVGAAVQTSASPSSLELLESRRAAGHLLDLTPVYKAWAALVQPLEIFGDRWLLNILFLIVFALLSFTLLAKAPRQ